MPGLDPRWLCIALTSIWMWGQSSNSNDDLPRDNGSDPVESQEAYGLRFIREEKNPDWVANIVPITKKIGKIRVCIDFSDLNKAWPKDEFPLPITDVMIDNTCGFEQMSFMDGFSGYNQIKMYHDDEKYTSFRIPLGMYCYTVMPFGLKNMRGHTKDLWMQFFTSIYAKQSNAT